MPRNMMSKQVHNKTHQSIFKVITTHKL